MERLIEVYGEFYRKHMIDYLIKNNQHKREKRYE